MGFSSGTQFGSYQISGPLGAGGMGEVYRATDTKLKRDVALKVLPADFATDVERLARFQREAELLASLNHPNIAQIFGLEKADGITALVMELIDGPTLAERLQQGALPVDEALNVATQIAAALEAAHGRGIIHRDLKPANIKLKLDGSVKVLDFGIAKALEMPAGTSGPHSPALTTPAMTMSGVILGTAAYMSPEQARGKTVDERADIWSFGCVLYEMLTGQAVFGGEDVTVTLARVLERDTDFSALPATLAPAVRHTLKLRLRKDPKKRIRHISDVRLALAGEFESGSGHAARLTHKQSFLRTTLPVALALALATGLAVWFLTQPPVVQAPVTRFVHNTSPGLSLRNTGRNVLAVSPDGRRFVYNTAQGLYLRELGELDARLIPGTEAPLLNPVFSPDSQSVAYWSSDGTTLMRIAISGGAPVVVARNTAPVRGASWASDGSILFGSSDGIYRVPANGGTQEQVLASDDWANAPELLPDGDHLIYTYGNQDPGQIIMESLSSGERTVLIPAGRDAHYLDSGHLTYVYENNLLAVAFDPASGVVSGSPVPLVQGIAYALNSASTNHGFSDTGTLVYLRGLNRSLGFTLAWVNREGQSEPIALPAREYQMVRLSPDGTRLTTSLENDLWVADIARGVFNRITATQETELWPVFTPDGQNLIFSMDNLGLGRIAADGTGAIEPLVKFDDTVLLSPGVWTPDQTLLFTRQTAQGPRLGRISPFAVAERPVPWEFALDRAHGAAGSNLSPDGHWLTYHADDTGGFHVYLERYPELGNRQLVSDADGGWGAIWSADGTEVFYRRLGDGAMMVVPITTNPSLSIGTARMLFKTEGYLPTVTPGPTTNGSARNWDLAPDGRFVMVRLPNFDTDNEFIVVENWKEELQRLAPVESR